MEIRFVVHPQLAPLMHFNQVKVLAKGGNNRNKGWFACEGKNAEPTFAPTTLTEISASSASRRRKGKVLVEKQCLNRLRIDV